MKNQPVQSEIPIAQADCGLKESAFLDSLNRAIIGTGTAANADVSVDNVLLIALGNSLDRAVVSTGTALNASIRDIVSHINSSICSL